MPGVDAQEVLVEDPPASTLDRYRCRGVFHDTVILASIRLWPQRDGDGPAESGLSRLLPWA